MRAGVRTPRGALQAAVRARTWMGRRRCVLHMLRGQDGAAGERMQAAGAEGGRPGAGRDLVLVAMEHQVFRRKGGGGRQAVG